MPKSSRADVSIPVPSVSPKQSDGHPLVPIALFSGIGLLISLVAILMGVQGTWY